MNHCEIIDDFCTVEDFCLVLYYHSCSGCEMGFPALLLIGNRIKCSFFSLLTDQLDVSPTGHSSALKWNKMNGHNIVSYIHTQVQYVCIYINI